MIKLPKFIVKLYSKRCNRRLSKMLREIDTCSCIFGMPRSGKTSFCAYISHLASYCNPPIKVYSNVPIEKTIMFSKSDFGKYDMQDFPNDTIIIIDEASLDFSNRDYQTNFNKGSHEALKLLGHRHQHLLVLSQVLDMDVKFIRQSHNVYQLKKGLFGFSKLLRVPRKLDVVDGQWQDIYVKPNGLMAHWYTWRFFRPLYYKMFDSYDAPKLPKMEEKYYNECKNP